MSTLAWHSPLHLHCLAGLHDWKLVLDLCGTPSGRSDLWCSCAGRNPHRSHIQTKRHHPIGVAYGTPKVGPWALPRRGAAGLTVYQHAREESGSERGQRNHENKAFRWETRASWCEKLEMKVRSYDSQNPLWLRYPLMSRL